MPPGLYPGVRPGTAQPRPRRSKLIPVLSTAAVLAVLAGGAGAYFVFLKKPTPAAASRGHAVVQVPKGPEQVLSVTPGNGATGVNGGAPIVVHFAKELAATSPMPVLSPAINGTWARVGNDAVFTPQRGYYPGASVTLTVPSGPSGVVTAAKGLLGAPVTARFTVGQFSDVRLEQLLAQLGYLPLTWTQTPATPVTPAKSAHKKSGKKGVAPSASPSATGGLGQLNLNQQWSYAFSPPSGTYTWSSASYPSNLMSLWVPNAPSKVLQGAVMAFQADHNLMTDMVTENQNGTLTLSGGIGQRLWSAVLAAVAAKQVNTHGYTYALASQKSPETLTVWHNGVQIFRNLANTGIPVSPTAIRTDPVYIRYQNQIMRGTNPNGTKYADPVAWVAYFWQGEAVHYFPRYSYGFQQSLGCVELPWAPAKQIWPYLTYGTLVTVTAP